MLDRISLRAVCERCGAVAFVCCVPPEQVRFFEDLVARDRVPLRLEPWGGTPQEFRGCECRQGQLALLLGV